MFGETQSWWSLTCKTTNWPLVVLGLPSLKKLGVGRNSRGVRRRASLEIYTRQKQKAQNPFLTCYLLTCQAISRAKATVSHGTNRLILSDRKATHHPATSGLANKNHTSHMPDRPSGNLCVRHRQ